MENLILMFVSGEIVCEMEAGTILIKLDYVKFSQFTRYRMLTSIPT